jgi:lantibiotic biosynthesis protein
MTPVFVAQATALARIPLGAALLSGEETDEAVLREAVFLASRRVPLSDTLGRQDDRAARTRRGYAIRLRSRTTPHGVLAGVALARFGDNPSTLTLGQGHHVRTTPGVGWLAVVCDQVLAEPGVLRQLTLHTTTPLPRHGDRYHSEQRGGPTDAGPRATAVRATEVMVRIVEACRGGSTAREVIEMLGRRWPQAPAATAARTLIGLIRAGVLLHDLLPEDPREDPLGHLLERLPNDSPRRTGLARLRDLLADADRYPPGAPERWQALTAARGLMDQIWHCERPLRADTVLDATIALPASLAQEAAEAAGLLWQIGWGSPPLRDYHESFCQRYGAHRSVPLLEATDPAVGLGCAIGVPGIGPAVPDARREAVLARLLAEATAQGRAEICLDPDTIAELRAPTGEMPPRTAEIYARVLADAADESAADRMCLALLPMGGSQDAGSTAGRFSTLLPGVYAEAESETDDVAVVAELVVASRTFDTASVAAETGFATHRIPVGVPARPGDLLPDELLLLSTGRQLILWSPRLRRQVIPVLYSRLAPELLPPLARLLSLVGQGDARPWHGWAWRVDAPFHPAVRHRRVLLAPPRWTLPPQLIRAANSAAEWNAALQTWRAETRPVPPPVVVTDDADRQLPLDLNQPHDRELLRRYTRRGLLAVTGPLPETAQAVLSGPGGRHLLDLVIPLRRTGQGRQEPFPAPPAPRATGAGLHLPGSDWLSLSLWAPAEHHDAILRTVSGVAADTAGHWDRWFWLRYHDSVHGPQLRIRFHGRPAALGGDVLPALAIWGTDLYRQRLSGGFSIEPYEQETERYGGSGAIGAAEEVFCTDSALVLEALARTSDDEGRLVIAALSVAAMARCLTVTPSAALGKHRLDRAARRRAAALRSQVRSADHCGGVPSLAATWAGRALALSAYRRTLSAGQLPACASAVIHLHCNRLVPGAGNERLARALAADLLTVRSHANTAADPRDEAL